MDREALFEVCTASPHKSNVTLTTINDNTLPLMKKEEANLKNYGFFSRN